MRELNAERGTRTRMEYDTIVVGAGSAGATLAARLAGDPARQILLLESGLDWRSADAPAALRSPNPSAIITAAQFAPFRFDDLEARRTRVQSARLYWRGRGLGGSSAVNGQIAIRAIREDFDRWVAAGCAGWSFEEVLPFYCRLETDLAFGDRPYHGNDGPIPIYRAPLARFGSVDHALAESALDAGVPWAPDHNAPDAWGVSPYAINSRDDARVSTNDAYLEPKRGANNLSIRGRCHVDRVRFEGARAVGVEVVADNRRELLRARRVVLCAGVIHSPAILVRSGVGPAETLGQLGIDVVVDLPVGEGLQDHPLFALTLRLRDAHVPPPGFRHTNCCVRLASGHRDGGAGDLMFVSMNRLGDSLGRRSRADEPPSIGMLGVWLNRCFSRGALRFRSRDPLVHPEVQLDMLDDVSDRARLRDGVRRLAEFARHRSVAHVAEDIAVTTSGWLGGSSATIGLDALARLDNSDLDALLLSTVGDAQHGTSTCRMGDPASPSTVVDPDCRVLGVSGLRVIDASVMPEVPCANTHLTTVMIAERMAERMANGTED